MQDRLPEELIAVHTISETITWKKVVSIVLQWTQETTVFVSHKGNS